MKAIAILILIAVMVALVAGPAMTVVNTKYEQARADRQAAEARMELARADAYAVRSQANQPVLLAITGLVLAVTVLGGLAVVLTARRPHDAQPTPPVPQITMIVLSQIPGESRPEYLRRLEAASQEFPSSAVLDARPRVEVGRSLQRPDARSAITNG